MLKVFVLVALLAFAAAAPSPVPGPKPDPAPAPAAKPGVLISAAVVPTVEYEYVAPVAYVAPYYSAGYVLV